jgi:hypothetical protein
MGVMEHCRDGEAGIPGSEQTAASAGIGERSADRWAARRGGTAGGGPRRAGRCWSGQVYGSDPVRIEKGFRILINLFQTTQKGD